MLGAPPAWTRFFTYRKHTIAQTSPRRDFIHPTGELGDVLFADYLVHYLSEAERALSEADGSSTGSSAGSSAANLGLAALNGSSGSGGSPGCPECPRGGGVPSLPAAPLYPKGRDVYHMRCYGSSSAAVGGY